MSSPDEHRLTNQSTATRPTPEQRKASGKAARTKTPLEAHAELPPPVTDVSIKNVRMRDNLADPGTDPYTALGLAPTATRRQIRHAYRTLLRQHLPRDERGPSEGRTIGASVVRRRRRRAASSVQSFVSSTPTSRR